MKRHLFSILCSVIVLSSLLVLPAAVAFTKSWTKDFATSKGLSTYTLTISSPDVVSNGGNWTIFPTLTVDHMDKYKTFLFFSTIQITVETEDGQQVKKSLQFGHYPIGEFPDRLYPGGRWGPNNVTINLREAGLDAPLGGSVDATIYVTVNIAEFLYQPFRAEQLPQTTYETFSLEAGRVRILSEGNMFSAFLPYIFGAMVTAVIFFALLLRFRFTGRRSP